MVGLEQLINAPTKVQMYYILKDKLASNCVTMLMLSKLCLKK